eukprot:COSAG01_NODE_15266_length_1356_cov_0.789181_2_plen_31_part_01
MIANAQQMPQLTMGGQQGRRDGHPDQSVDAS